MNLSANFQRYLIYIVIFTCSFEIFLVINIGFNFKACQIALILCSFLWAVEVASARQKIAIPPHLFFISTAFLLSILFIPNSDLLERNVGYALWLLFDILGVVIFFNVFKNPKTFIQLCKVSLLANCFVAAFGLAQFALGVLGLPTPLVTQWWIEGVLPRINGFNYEPSFYATYLVLGWIFSCYLYEKNSPLVSRRLVLMSTLLSTAALLLCSSRMGWFAMGIWLSRPGLKAIRDLAKYQRLSLTQLRLFGAYAGAFFTLLIIIFSVFSLDQLQILIAGLGIVEQGGSYSADERSETTLLTGKLALDHLYYGVGLGGIPGELAKLSGTTITSIEDAKNFEGKNITFEIVSGIGIVGAISVYAFIGFTINQALSISRRLTSDNSPEALFLSASLRGLAWAVVIEFILLQLNQNFLRTYTWTFIAILFAGIRSSNQYLETTNFDVSYRKALTC